MIINVCIELINVASMSDRCLFNEQACFSDDNINESSMLPMCSRLGSKESQEQALFKIFSGELEVRIFEHLGAISLNYIETNQRNMSEIISKEIFCW